MRLVLYAVHTCDKERCTMLKMLLTVLLAATQGQSQQACDDADAAIKAQQARLDAERTAVAAYKGQVASLRSRFNVAVAALKMDAVERSTFNLSLTGPDQAGILCDIAADCLTGLTVIGAVPQLTIAKKEMAASSWDRAVVEANVSLGWSTNAKDRLDKVAVLHASIDAGLIKADSILTKYGY